MTQSEVGPPPNIDVEPQTHAEAVSRMQEVRLPKSIEPSTHAEEAPGALSGKKEGG